MTLSLLKLVALMVRVLPWCIKLKTLVLDGVRENVASELVMSGIEHITWVALDGGMRLIR